MEIPRHLVDQITHGVPLGCVRMLRNTLDRGPGWPCQVPCAFRDWISGVNIDRTVSDDGRDLNHYRPEEPDRLAQDFTGEGLCTRGRSERIGGRCL